MRFKTDQSHTASPWTLWLVQGWPKTKASWIRVNVMTFLGDKRKGYLLFPAGLAPGRFCNYSRCHHREPQNKSDDKARAGGSRKSGSWWHDVSPCTSAFLIMWANKCPFSLSQLRSGFLFCIIQREPNDTADKQRQPLSLSKQSLRVPPAGPTAFQLERGMSHRWAWYIFCTLGKNPLSFQ